MACPPTDGGIFVPQQALSAFNGEDSQGIWQLEVSDEVAGAGGSLTNWSLEFCFAEDASYVLNTTEEVINLCENGETSFEIEALPVFDFSNSITLSVSNLTAGVTASFDPATITPGESSSLTLSANEGAVVGVHEFIVNGQSGSIDFSLDVNLNINEEIPDPV